MRGLWLGLPLPAIILSAGCAKGIQTPTADATSGNAPRISWVFMHGDRGNPDRDYMCQSDARDECVVPASRDNAPVFSDVHVYYHAAAAETNYSGTIRIGFFRSGATTNAQSTVRQRQKAGTQSVTGIVTSMPGRYQVTIDVTATAKDGITQPIRLEVPVTVK